MDPMDQSEVLKSDKTTKIKAKPAVADEPKSPEAPKQKKIRIHLLVIHQPVQFPSEDCNPKGNTSSSFKATDYFMEPHPIGVRVKRKESDNFGMIIGASNVKQIYFKEE